MKRYPIFLLLILCFSSFLFTSQAQAQQPLEPVAPAKKIWEIKKPKLPINTNSFGSNISTDGIPIASGGILRYHYDWQRPKSRPDFEKRFSKLVANQLLLVLQSAVRTPFGQGGARITKLERTFIKRTRKAAKGTIKQADQIANFLNSVTQFVGNADRSPNYCFVEAKYNSDSKKVSTKLCNRAQITAGGVPVVIERSVTGQIWYLYSSYKSHEKRVVWARGNGEKLLVDSLTNVVAPTKEIDEYSLQPRENGSASLIYSNTNNQWFSSIIGENQSKGVPQGENALKIQGNFGTRRGAACASGNNTLLVTSSSDEDRVNRGNVLLYQNLDDTQGKRIWNNSEGDTLVSLDCLSMENGSLISINAFDNENNYSVIIKLNDNGEVIKQTRLTNSYGDKAESAKIYNYQDTIYKVQPFELSGSGILWSAMKSTDGGQTWSLERKLPGADNTYFASKFRSARPKFAVLSDGSLAVVRSTNPGPGSTIPPKVTLLRLTPAN